ncbi:hypothetical protein HY623_01105 [Candidatus Uhrbacteria bacterium]|nr:hypothetical protein [Candidatus Uhrbacteria bacterium]
MNVFLVGTGLIGSTLLTQIRENQSRLKAEGVELSVCGIANAERMLLDANGIALDRWQERLAQDGISLDLAAYISASGSWRMPRSVFVDCTASQDVADAYCSIARTGAAIVAANKKAQSGSLDAYETLWKTLHETRTSFLYETNVGAALPVISALKDLLVTGDRVEKIEAILSGTLSYIFNTYSDSRSPFSDIVREAKEKGYTEPDPRDDLSGLDVARKAVILAREIGQKISVEDIARAPLLSDTCMSAGSVDDFFSALESMNAEWEEKKQSAKSRGSVLRYIATIDQSGARISLEEVNQTHAFYSLSGSDNIVAFTTARYCDTPLVIKGPGAGAQVTAGGVFADILKTGYRV